MKDKKFGKGKDKVDYPLPRKLIIGVIIVLLQIGVIVAGVQVITSVFRKTTEKLITEYHELHALQEYKMSLGKIVVAVKGLESNYNLQSEQDLVEITVETQREMDECKVVLTSFHSLEYLVELDSALFVIEDAVCDLALSGQKDITLLNEVLFTSWYSIEKIDALIAETKEEIDEYERKSQLAILHGSFTIGTFGALLILVLLFGGIWYIRKLTRPIKQLVDATQKISEGEKNYRVEVDSRDEFLILADSFNKMLDNLETTTISEEYLKSIVENLSGSLVVTNRNCRIRSVNTSTLNLFGYKEKELLMAHISILFNDTLGVCPEGLGDDASLMGIVSFFREQNLMVSKNGKAIPVLVTCTILKNKNGEPDGLLIVGHDLSDKMAHDEEMDRIRRGRQIAINEAQEVERMRIATDIHDGLGQMLTSVSYYLEELAGKDADNPVIMDKIQKQLDATIQEAKNLSHNLIPIILKDFGLLAAIQQLIEKGNQHNSTVFSFNHYDFDGRIDARLEKAIYRICQEGLNNIIKHSGASHASFQIFKSDNTIVLTIEDDGKGFDPDIVKARPGRTGIGLMSIRERVSSFNGIFTIDSVEGTGTEIIIEIPV